MNTCESGANAGASPTGFPRLFWRSENASAVALCAKYASVTDTAGPSSSSTSIGVAVPSEERSVPMMEVPVAPMMGTALGMALCKAAARPLSLGPAVSRWPAVTKTKQAWGRQRAVLIASVAASVTASARVSALLPQAIGWNRPRHQKQQQGVLVVIGVNYGPIMDILWPIRGALGVY